MDLQRWNVEMIVQKEREPPKVIPLELSPLFQENRGRKIALLSTQPELEFPQVAL